jgi:hypothetical protein
MPEPTDIIERLRGEGSDAMRKHLSLGMFNLCAEAADEIEHLRRMILSALDCLGNDDPEGAYRALTAELEG